MAFFPYNKRCLKQMHGLIRIGLPLLGIQRLTCRTQNLARTPIPMLAYAVSMKTLTHKVHKVWPQSKCYIHLNSMGHRTHSPSQHVGYIPMKYPEPRRKEIMLQSMNII